jgi:hypothetical protein
MADLAPSSRESAVQSKLQDIRIANEEDATPDARDLIAAVASQGGERCACASPTSPSVAHPIIRENAPLTPRRYIKALHSMLKLIAKHEALLNDAVQEARQVRSLPRPKRRRWGAPCAACCDPDTSNSFPGPGRAPHAGERPPGARAALGPSRPPSPARRSSSCAWIRPRFCTAKSRASRSTASCARVRGCPAGGGQAALAALAPARGLGAAPPRSTLG